MITITDHAEGCILPVRAQPGARRNGVQGKQGGALKIPKGKCLDPNTKAGIDALYSMQWLVKGVVGSPKG